MAWVWEREWDSNPRPPGYEPDELPLLYPATREIVKRCVRVLSDAASSCLSPAQLLRISFALQLLRVRFPLQLLRVA